MKKLRYVLAGVLVLAGLICLFPRSIVKAGDASNTRVTGGLTTHQTEARATEVNQDSLLKSQPLPSALSFSTERDNLINKLKFESKKGSVGYVALIGPMGQLVAYYTIQGKVSSLNSYLTTTEQVVGGHNDQSDGLVTVDSPDLDGSYGVNPEGIFFFTTSNRYVEWSGNYLFSDQPMSYVTAPILLAK